MKSQPLSGWDFFCPFPLCWRGFRARPRERHPFDDGVFAPFDASLFSVFSSGLASVREVVCIKINKLHQCGSSRRLICNGDLKYKQIAREANVGGILYRSVRDLQPSWCWALLTPTGFAKPKPHADRQT